MQWKQHFSTRQWLMEHDRIEDFSTSCWQREPSSVPLLTWRLIKLLWAVGTWSWSVGRFWGPFGQWFIYMTHWGITGLMLHSILGTAISLAAKCRKLPDPAFGLPWYIKTYWVLFNISAPVAFLITLFYWVVLYGSDALVDYAPNQVLDISLHGVNSIVMLVELMTAAHPSRILHVYQPVGFGLAYLIFGLVYYFAGGLDPSGNPWIYPVIDWSKPGPTVAVVAVTTVVLVLLHMLTVAISVLRDRCSRRLLKTHPPAPGFTNDGFVAA